MKHLKTYKIFESNNQITNNVYNNKEVLNNIEEIFREISDIGFRIEYNRGGVDELLKIYIEKPMATELDEYRPPDPGTAEFADNLTFRKEFKYYPTVEFINSFLHLISYAKESNIDYRIEVIGDSQVIDVLYTESEIENIINWKHPIDYIKVIISEKEIVS